MDEGFCKGQSDNLPKVDMFMVATFIKNAESFSLGEVRGVKADRNQDICTVKGKITSEHNVRKQQYSVSCSINEVTEEVIDVQCYDCAASLGGCKHTIAFLMWLHRRSEEPSPTEITCYWAKSKLSKVGTSIKFITLKEFGAKEELASDEESTNFLEEVLKRGSETDSDSQLLKHFATDEGIDEKLGLHQLMHKFVLQGGKREYSEFFTYCSNVMNIQLCVSKIKPNSAMLRGKTLEKEVVKCLKKELKTNFKHIGLQLNPKYPIFGASPDALCNEYCIEVKCPNSEKSLSTYLTKDKKITAKYNAQVQLQMWMLQQ
ncbi:uncharacterized protein LOC126734668 [Anthonomus grandis grandis]|uniref:uncharacterized protein LOC126734668 n=1 Tax=Anthonomus grandis grandis TaxID=2921223 RepID=UPI0021666D63|nr:uncharacterized protein LOC126734668 [Anthonomus grandis grandis]